MYTFETAKTATRHFPADRPVLPEWTRKAWASMNERGWWEPYLLAASNAWAELEKWTVVHGHRQAAWITVPVDQLLSTHQWAAAHDVILIPKAKVPITQGYSSASRPLMDNEPFSYRALLVRPESYSRTQGHVSDDMLGELLGYPTCCREAFARTWGAGQIDSTYDQYMGNSEPTADGPVEANILWRWLGIRWVSHLPCSFTCERTVELGQKYRETAMTQGYYEELVTIDTVLRWPTMWSAINGIGEIVGPCVKVSTRTDWSPEPRLMKRQGTYAAPEPTLWSDNGFSSPEAMRQSHDPILAALREFIPKDGHVRDLGCGNGFLLKRLRIVRPDLRIGGIDIKEDAIVRAKQSLVGKWYTGRIQDLGWCPCPKTPPLTSVVISPIRLLEMTPEDAEKVRTAIHGAPQVFVYAYNDCIQTHQSLTALCKTAGLPTPGIISANSDVQVGVIRHVNRN